MKKSALTTIIILLTGILFQASALSSKQADDVPAVIETEFKVLGLCGMCKDRIEKAAYSVRGVRRASWDQQNQMLKVSYRTNRTDQQTIERAIAKAGHDTQNFITDETTHANLHHCCKYARDPEMLKNNKLYDQD